jgi:haloacetate dehalogenase
VVQRDDLEDLYGDPLVIWRDWADDVRGHSIDSAHHMAEEAPDVLAAALGEFFAPPSKACDFSHPCAVNIP